MASYDVIDALIKINKAVEIDRERYLTLAREIYRKSIIARDNGFESAEYITLNGAAEKEYQKVLHEIK